jgi:hypothetical protein
VWSHRDARETRVQMLLSEVRGVESSRLGPKAETRKRVCESEEQWLRGYSLTS